jgi:LPXTG-motif cell wall-anchored protein
VFNLGPGSHSITLTVAATVGTGAAYLRVSSAATVPVLSAPVLAGLGILLAALASWFLRRRPEMSR